MTPRPLGLEQLLDELEGLSEAEVEALLQGDSGGPDLHLSNSVPETGQSTD